VIGAYYYLKVIVYMYMREPKPGAPIATPMKSGFVAAALLIAAVIVLTLGVFPDTALQMAGSAVLK